MSSFILPSSSKSGCFNYDASANTLPPRLVLTFLCSANLLPPNTLSSFASFSLSYYSYIFLD